MEEDRFTLGVQMFSESLLMGFKIVIFYIALSTVVWDYIAKTHMFWTP